MLGSMVEPSPLRRHPRQARAQERLERILDTAEQVFAELGYESATTNLIASQAGTSIGSLYEFFPNKEALARALADRYVERIGTLYTVLLVDRPDQPQENLVHEIIASLDRFYRDHPGAVPLLNGRRTSNELASAGERLQAAFVSGIERIIEARDPQVPIARRHLIASVIAEVARALLTLADSVALSQRQSVIREIEYVVVGYLDASQANYGDVLDFKS
jgi:AcrR family transcriptional regulator